ncbi:MAG TPA: hypothetical protein V6D22_09220 [Candidatus Obscuribacterales bacterium]
MRIKPKPKPTNKQPTVRINAAAKQKLDRLQSQTDKSQPDLLDRAIDLLEWEMLAQQAAADFAAIADDPETLALYHSSFQPHRTKEK